MELPFPFPTDFGDEIPVLTSPLFIVGANGSGKSMLVQDIVKVCHAEQVKYNRIAAHRQIWMQDSYVNMAPASRVSYNSQHRNEETKVRSRWLDYKSATLWQTALYDLVAEDNTWAHRIAEEKNAMEADKIRRTHPRPLEQVNELLASAGLNVAIKYYPENGVVKATHKDGGLNMA